jgi:putative tryptophan/tyrosine transport system substrate-binding protein
MRQWRATGAVRMADSLMWLLRAKTSDLAIRHRLPIMYVFRTETEGGGLMSYGPDGVECFTRAPEYVDRILKGARAGDLPVQRATRLEFVINLKAARAIGLSIPREVAARADTVIE